MWIKHSENLQPRSRQLKIVGLALTLALVGAAATATAGSHAAMDLKAANSAVKLKPKWYQVGIATWYGRQFQGHKTASGEAFDLHMLTCAHRTLPIGTLLRVTNLGNRRSIMVRVNDRGPVPAERIVDLSYAAAQSLGFKNHGNVHVKLERIDGAEAAQLNWPNLGRPENPTYSR